MRGPWVRAGPQASADQRRGCCAEKGSKAGQLGGVERVPRRRRAQVRRDGPAASQEHPLTRPATARPLATHPPPHYLSNLQEVEGADADRDKAERFAASTQQMLVG